jgi:hypothetical protein
MGGTQMKNEFLFFYLPFGTIKIDGEEGGVYG